MKEEHWFELIHNNIAKGWSAKFSQINSGWVDADTAPLAICLAALQAIGNES
jgi:hypothetical protein